VSRFARNDLPTTDYLLTTATKPGTEIFTAATIWQPADRISHWIELGAGVNSSAAAAQYARTPLMNAVTSEAVTVETVKLLLDRGADPNAKMTEGETSLDWAIYSGDRAKIQALEQHGAVRGNGPRREEIAPPERGGIADPRVSLTRSIPPLLDAALKFREQATCISCHHNALPALTAAVARRKGIEIDDARARKNLENILTFFRASAPRMTLGDPAVGGEALTAGYAQLALSANGYPLDRVTATMTHWVLARQMPDGRLVIGGWRNTAFDAESGFDTNPTPNIQQQIEQGVAELVPGGAPVEYRWAGTMGFARDGRPLVGWLDAAHHLAIAAGFTGHGMGMATACTEDLAELLAFKRAPAIASLDPQRFAEVREARDGLVALGAVTG